jgi:GTPase SAR1 family protein
MGLCASSEDPGKKAKVVSSPEERKADKQIEDEMAAARNEDARLKKLLLLGPGQSGKTTIYRQLVNLYGEKYDEEKLMSFRPIVHTNVLNSIKKLVDMSWNLVQENVEYALHVDNLEKAKMIQEMKEESELTPAIGKIISELWNDPAIKKTFEHSSKFQLLESTEYLFARLEEICQPRYLPSLQDVLRSRAATTGIVETEFEIEGSKFVMIDVGGQRNERKKWIHCFEGVTSLIYVASLSCFDQKLFEDENTNAMQEALDLFEDTVNLHWFGSTDIILFLNKSDLFRDKLAKSNISVFFKDYKGSNDFKESVDYIEEEFRMRVKDGDKDLYCHVTCATDTGNVQFTFNAVKNIIIRKGLSEAGIIS